MLHGTVVEGPFGRFGVVAGERGVRAVAPLGALPPAAEVTWHAPGDVVPAPLALAAHWLQGYFGGARAAWEGALDVVGTPFQHEVWSALRALPFGASTTCGALAAQLGRPHAARAVGAAVGRNPVALLVPCHRVLGPRGEVSGATFGLPLKRALLVHEGLRPPTPGPRELLGGLPLQVMAC